MKKLCLLILLIFSTVTMSFTMENASASGTTYPVNFTGNFSTDNLGIDYVGDHTYGSRLSFDSSINDLEGYSFSFWIVNGHVRYDLPVNHQFIINGSMDIEAVFSKDTTYAVVFMDTNGNSLDIQYVLSGQDATPPLVGELPDKPGFVVNETTPWSESYQNITNHTVTILQYTISSVTTFTIGVTNGTGSGDYTFNDTVTVVANAPTGDDYFLYWQENGVIVSYNETYKFAALRNRSLTAVYGASPVTNNPLITLSSDLEIRTNYASYVGQFSLPGDHTLIEYGILRSNTNATPVHDSVDATRYRSEKYNGTTGEYLMSFSDDKVYQRAYLVSEDTLGTLHYTYSNVIETVTYSVSLSANHVSAVVDTVQAPPYFEGDSVDITASSVTGYNFLHWYDLDSNVILTTTQNPTLTMNRNYNIEARYQDENIIFDYDFSELTSLPSNLTYSKTYSGGDILFDDEDYYPNGDYLRINFSPATSGTITLTIVYTCYMSGAVWDDTYFWYSAYDGEYEYSQGYSELTSGTHTITTSIDYWGAPGMVWFLIDYDGFDSTNSNYVLIHSIKAEYN